VDRRLFLGPFDDPFPDLPRPRVLFVGRLHKAKGVDVALAAFGRLHAAGAHLVLVGDGPERPALEAEAARLGLADRVRFVGFLPHHRVPAALSNADVLVVPSVYEELGRVVLEAMQVGLPVVATATGGIPEVIHDGLNGFLVRSAIRTRWLGRSTQCCSVLVWPPGLPPPAGETRSATTRTPRSSECWRPTGRRSPGVQGFALRTEFFRSSPPLSAPDTLPRYGRARDLGRSPPQAARIPRRRIDTPRVR
jgi:hypothetical protein